MYNQSTEFVGVIMPLIYNAFNLQAWNTEIKTLNAQKQHHQELIKEHNQLLLPLQNQRQALQPQIASLQSQISIYEIKAAQDNAYHWQQSHHNNHHHHHNHHHHSHHHHYHHQHSPGIIHTTIDIFNAFELTRLRTQYNELLAEASRIDGKIRPHLHQTQESSNFTMQANARINTLNHTIQKGSDFLNKLHTNPQPLILELKNKIIAAFQTYKDNHPQGLSPQVRICLIKIQERLNYLTLDPHTHSLNDFQTNYLHIHTLLKSMHDQIIAEGENREFSDLLNSLLEETHIDTDLPDDLQTHKSFNEHYQHLQQLNPSLFMFSIEELTTFEQQYYQSQLNQLQNRAFKENSLQKKINAALRIISEEVEAKKQKQELIDYHYYNQVLNDLAIIAIDPKANSTIQHLNTLAQVSSGTPDLGKKIAGALLAVLGVVLIATSITCLVATFGASSFASAFGVALGVGLLESQITLGMSGSLLAMGGIGFSFWGGMKFKEGQRQGLSKALEEIKEEALQSIPSF